MQKAITLITILLLLAPVQQALAHCEIPCGIYGDSLRFAQIREHITTVEKSIKKITELSNEDDEDYNQIVRWVVNKEDHAIKIQDIMSQYFLHQRITPIDKGETGYETYLDLVTTSHKIMVYAMKAKQGTDLQWIKKLREAVDHLEELYFHKH